MLSLMPSPTLCPARTLARVLLPLLTLAMIGAVPVSSAQAAVTSATAAVYENQAVNSTNNQRARRHLRTLRTDACLTRFANRQAVRMATQHRIYHQDLGPVLRKCGLRRVGENVAVGYASGKSVVNDGWMHSPGHRHNILTRPFRVVAVGAAQDDHGRWYTAQVLGHR